MEHVVQNKDCCTERGLHSITDFLLSLPFWLKRYFTSTETVGLLGTGAQDGHLDFHTVSELCAEIKSAPFSDVTSTGRVWRTEGAVKSNARSVSRFGLAARH